MSQLLQWMGRKGLSGEGAWQHLCCLSAPSTLPGCLADLVGPPPRSWTPPPPDSSPVACRHARPFPGHLWRRHLAGTCLWATFHGTRGTRDNRTSSPQRNMSHPTNPMLTQPGR